MKVRKGAILRNALIKSTICAIAIISVISLGIVSIANPEKLTIATPDEATVDEVVTVAETTIISTESTEKITEQPTTESSTEKPTIKPTEQPTEKETEKATEKPKETKPLVEETNSYLLDIGNPDSSYSPQAFSLSDSERYNVACVVMGEFGDGGFTGCALIAQAIRDAMQTYGYSANSALSNMGYYGYNNNPNLDSYSAVDYIFSGNAAVQHRILYMNNSSGGWHGTQQYILNYQGVWFYDKW